MTNAASTSFLVSSIRGTPITLDAFLSGCGGYKYLQLSPPYEQSVAHAPAQEGLLGVVDFPDRVGYRFARGRSPRPVGAKPDIP